MRFAGLTHLLMFLSLETLTSIIRTGLPILVDLDFFLSSDVNICSTMAFPPLRNSDHDIPTNSQRDAPFHCIVYDYSCADWDGLRDHLRDVP